MVKAAMGGGGRGMRVALSADQLDDGLDQASARPAPPSAMPTFFLEKYVQRARHIEVQLWETAKATSSISSNGLLRAAPPSKVVEIAPAPNLSEATRQALYQSALAIGQAAHLDNAGTVEFYSTPKASNSTSLR